MSLRKLLPIVSTIVVCLAFSVGNAAAQARGGGGRGGGGGAHAAGPRPGAPATVGHAVPRPGYPGGHPGHPIYGRPGYPYYGYGRYPYYPYYGYGYGYPYYGYPGFSFGIGIGFGYGYGYGYYGYPYYGYAYPGYTYAAPVYVAPSGSGYVTAGGQTQAYGAVRLLGAPPDAQVYADGYFVGAVSDFNGSQQQLSLPAGVHKIEIRIAGEAPIEFDVNIQAGQTVTYRAGR